MEKNTLNLVNLISAMGLPVQEINTRRRYWFIRTQSGKYFSEFNRKNFVAIGHEEVPSLPAMERTPEIVNRVKQTYKQANRILNQVYRFCEEIKKDDIIIIPSTSSTTFLFGRVLEDSIYKVSPEKLEPGKCEFTRRRKVEWIRNIEKSKIDSKLYTFFRNQQTLSNIDSYGEFIDRAIYPFYIKNDVAHLTLAVGTQESPDALDIPNFLGVVINHANEMAEKLNLPSSKNNIRSRINVQSEGLIELFGNPYFLGLVAIAIISLVGGSIRFKATPFGLDGEAKTDGLAGFILRLLDKKPATYVQAKEAQERLKIQDPRTNKNE